MEYEYKLKTEMVKKSKPKLITITAVIKRQRLREERRKHKDNTTIVIEEETKVHGEKPLRHLPSGQ